LTSSSKDAALRLTLVVSFVSSMKSNADFFEEEEDDFFEEDFLEEAAFFILYII
jgi:hypothetical protein